jgi:hypothetical protein
MVPGARLGTCGEHGYKNAYGLPCGFIPKEGEQACAWHKQDPGDRNASIAARVETGKKKRIPRGLPDHEFQTTQDIRTTLAAVVKELSTKTTVDTKRLAVVIQACNAANAVLQTEAMKELNETVLRAEGHGPALVILEGLKAGRTRKLTGAGSRVNASGNGSGRERERDPTVVAQRVLERKFGQPEDSA